MDWILDMASHRTLTISAAPTESSNKYLIHGLGYLSKIPPEIRCLIFQYLMPEYRRERRIASYIHLSRTYNPPLQPYRLCILQASHHLYAEVSAQLYNNRELRLCIYPKQKDWIVNGLPDALPRDFESADYGKFHRILIEMHPPNVYDPGQMIQARRAVMDLVIALARSPNLPAVGIDLSGWSDENLSQRSISDLGECSLLWNDVELLVAPFFRLRGVPRVEIRVSATTTHEVRKDVEDLFEEVKKRMTISEAFGSCLGGDVWDDDGEMDSDEKAMTLTLDLKLDTLEGQTASSLRLDRFDNWWLYMVRTMRLIHDPYVHHSVVLSSWELDYQAEDALRDRYLDCRSWDPFSEQLMGPMDCESCEWSGNRWHVQYPQGIPPKGSPQWNQHMRKHQWKRPDTGSKDSWDPLNLSKEEC